MNKIYSLWLVLAFGSGNPAVTELLSRFGNAEKIYKAFESNCSLAGAEMVNRAASVSLKSAESKLKELENRKIRIITIEDEKYPQLLKKIDNPPYVLFARGNVSLLNTDTLSAAGSRNITGYTIAAQTHICERLCHKFTLVSTLTHGCDELSCITAIKENVGCIEVLPCGFDNEHPKGSRVLRELILRSGGCIVTEYLPEVKAANSSYKRRARIIGGISRVLLVFQAGAKSGALYVAECSGAPFIIPPHNIFAREYAGAAAFVRAGGRLFLNEADIYEIYKGNYSPDYITISVSEKETEKESAKTTETGKTPVFPEDFDSELHYTVYKKLAESPDPLCFDIILYGVPCGIGKLSEILLDLEISGNIKPLPGNRYEAI